MARRSRVSILKRQRELKKSEKAARKRAKRHGQVVDGSTEPRPTIRLSDLVDPTNPEGLERSGDEAESE